MTPSRRAEIEAYIRRLDLDQLPGWTVEQRIIADLWEALEADLRAHGERVTTFEELQALPLGSGLMANDGTLCRIQLESGSKGERVFKFTDGRWEYSALRMLRDFGSLAVVWRPSDAAS